MFDKLEKTFRWLAVFVLCNVAVAVGTALVLGILVRTYFFFGAVWDYVFNLSFQPYGIRVAWTLYEVRIEDAASIQNSILLSLILPGLFVAALAATAALKNSGWRVWRWNSSN